MKGFILSMLNKVQNVQVSDTTGDAIGIAVQYRNFTSALKPRRYKIELFELHQANCDTNLIHAR